MNRSIVGLFAVFAVFFVVQGTALGAPCDQDELSFSSWPLSYHDYGSSSYHTLTAPSGYSYSPFTNSFSSDWAAEHQLYPINNAGVMMDDINSPTPAQYKDNFLYFDGTLIIPVPNPNDFITAFEISFVHFATAEIHWKLTDRRGNVVDSGTEYPPVAEGVLYNETITNYSYDEKAFLEIRADQYETGLVKICHESQSP